MVIRKSVTIAVAVTALSAFTVAGAGAASARPVAHPTVAHPTVAHPAAARPAQGSPLLVFEALGLAVGTDTEGDLYAQGPASVVQLASQTIAALGIGQLVAYSGDNETGTGADLVTGTPAPGTCLDGPDTLSVIDNVDDLSSDPVQVFDGTCADRGTDDGPAIQPDQDANLSQPADFGYAYPR